MSLVSNDRSKSLSWLLGASMSFYEHIQIIGDKMIKESLTIYDDKGNYFVIANDVVKDCTFIVYMEGNPKGLMKLWLEHRECMPGKRVFFCDSGNNKYFKNNSVEVDDGLFEYTGPR